MNLGLQTIANIVNIRYLLPDEVDVTLAAVEIYLKGLIPYVRCSTLCKNLLEGENK